MLRPIDLRSLFTSPPSANFLGFFLANGFSPFLPPNGTKPDFFMITSNQPVMYQGAGHAVLVDRVYQRGQFYTAGDQVPNKSGIP